MIRKIAIIILSIATLGFLLLTIERMNMDYNENGVYFDGLATYNTDAILGYGVITSLLLLSTVVLLKKRSKKSISKK